MNALLFHGMKRAFREGIKYMDLGCSTINSQVQNMGVAEFKEGFGTKGVF